jgi:hypothetical protein
MEPLTPAGPRPDHGVPDPLPGRCCWPGCKIDDRQFTVVNGLDFCYLHAEAAINGERFSLTVKPLVGTGDP